MSGACKHTFTCHFTLCTALSQRLSDIIISPDRHWTPCLGALALELVAAAVLTLSSRGKLSEFTSSHGGFYNLDLL